MSVRQIEITRVCFCRQPLFVILRLSLVIVSQILIAGKYETDQPLLQGKGTRSSAFHPDSGTIEFLFEICPPALDIIC